MSRSDEKPVDFTKPVQTRDGRRVVLSTTNGVGQRPVVGQIALRHSPGEWEVRAWRANGQICPNSRCHVDLVNVPPQKKQVEGWVIIYNGAGASDFDAPGYLYLYKPYYDPKRHKAIKKVTIDFADGEVDE